MEIDTSEDIPPIQDTFESLQDDLHSTPILTPRNICITSSSPFMKIERLIKVDHGIDGDTKEKNPIISLAISPRDECILATGGHEGSVRIWSLPLSSDKVDPTMKDSAPSRKVAQVTTLVGHAGQVTAVRFSPTGEFLASCSTDATVRVYGHGKWKLLHSLRAHTLDVVDVAWFSDSILV